MNNLLWQTMQEMKSKLFQTIFNLTVCGSCIMEGACSKSLHIVWNMNLRVYEQLLCTINVLEGWHTVFAGGFRHHQVYIWKFVEKLQEISCLNYLQMAQITTWAANPPHCCAGFGRITEQQNWFSQCN